MNQILIKEPYDSYAPSIKEAFEYELSFAKNHSKRIDIIVPTLEHGGLLNFLDVKVWQTLQKKREFIYQGVKLKFYSTTTAKKINSSDALLILCVPDNFTEILSHINFKKCIVVPRHFRNLKCWRNYQNLMSA
ncbi:hypothetical protein [Litorilituus sediminis]|uniref:Uncharacterized protein n=1 Tax=Litorilituus sediminis TaxID=718192 RepID=A0A4P6P465_9GAMM|nr:hypothetical protein [Litorilituus sediminis]QBG36124.1 hypothetical protein EMK97_10575 [Litorilituus sediminis]